MKSGLRWISLGTASIVLFIAAAVFAENWIYYWLHAIHPRIYWLLALLVSVAVIGAWWLLTYTIKGAIEDASSLRREVSGHAGQIKALEDTQKEELHKARQQHDNNETGLMKLRESDRCRAKEATDLAEQLRQELTAKNSEIEALKPVLIDGVAVIGYAAEFMRQRANWNPTPDVTNVKGEILETLYRPDYIGFSFTGFDILLRVRLTNFGNNVATITRYRIRVDIGKNYWNGERADIPTSWILEREGPLMLLGGSSTNIEPIAPLNSASEPLLKGIPQTGWLMFKMSQGWVPGFQYPVGAQITLIVTDSFGTDHVIIKPCGAYATTTKVTTAKG